MSQHDFDISSQDANTGLTFRNEVNKALQALASMNSGPGNPAVMYPYQFKFNTAESPVGFYIRKGDNSAWVKCGYIDDSTGKLVLDMTAFPADITIKKQDAALVLHDPVTGKRFRFLHNDGDSSLIIQYFDGYSWTDLARTDGSVKFHMEKDYLCSYYLSADQTLPDITDTDVQFNTKISDVNNWFNTTTYEFKPTVEGFYIVKAQIGVYTDLVAAKQAICSILKNNVAVKKKNKRFANTNSLHTVPVSDIIYMNGTTDAVKIQAYQDTGNSTVKIYGSQVYTNFRAFKIG